MKEQTNGFTSKGELKAAIIPPRRAIYSSKLLDYGAQIQPQFGALSDT